VRSEHLDPRTARVWRGIYQATYPIVRTKLISCLSHGRSFHFKRSCCHKYSDATTATCTAPWTTTASPSRLVFKFWIVSMTYDTVTFRYRKLRAVMHYGSDRLDRAVFLKLGSAKGCQWFRCKKMRNGGRFYWRSKISTYEYKWKISFNYGVLSVILLKTLFTEHVVYQFYSLI
jgi:hypothetical protein